MRLSLVTLSRKETKMMHPYNEDLLSLTQEKLGEIFELAVLHEKISINSFAGRFLSSNVCPAFEGNDLPLLLGKSSNELLALILGKEPKEYPTSDYATPEYWVGWVLAYAQWSLNKSFDELIEILPCGELINLHFPYHEMDVTKAVDLFKERFTNENILKRKRKELGLSQPELAYISGISERSIKAYEQGKVELSKASGETLYALAKALHCSMEELLKNSSNL